MITDNDKIMRALHSKNAHNIKRFCIDKAIVRRTNWLVQEQLTQYIRNLLIQGGKLSFRQSSKDKSFRINKLVLQLLYFKSYPKLSFCGYSYCAVLSLFGIKYAEEIKNCKASYKDYIELSGIERGIFYQAEIGKGVQLAKYVKMK